jgi:hypothetical protein
MFLRVTWLTFALLLTACGGKIAPDADAGLQGTCGAHSTSEIGARPSCRTVDSVTCTVGTFDVSCDCAAGTCTCSRDGVAAQDIPLPHCSCEPSREQLLQVYNACGFPY